MHMFFVVVFVDLMLLLFFVKIEHEVQLHNQKLYIFLTGNINTSQSEMFHLYKLIKRISIFVKCHTP